MSIEITTVDFIEKEKVFDTSLYLNVSEKRRVRVIANDLAGLVLEAGDRPLEERINPWYVVITPEGNAINLLSRENVTKNFGDKTHLAINETKGALDFYYNKALKAQEDDLIFSFSPSGGNSPYLEARINVAKVRTLFGMKVLECYGISSKLPSGKILEIANYLQIMSEESLSLTPDALREVAVLWPHISGENTWEIFENNAKLDSNAWLEIANGTPRRIKNEAYKVALPVAKKMNLELKFAKTTLDFVRVGAAAEMYMIQNGFNINSWDCPGVFNMQLLNLNSSTTIDTFGNFRKVETQSYSGSKEYLCCECPFCKKEVMAEIYDGKIHCPDKPEGCGASAPYVKQAA